MSGDLMLFGSVKGANKPRSHKKKPVKPLTERPIGNAKRLSLTEKLVIKAEKGTGRSITQVSKAHGLARSTVRLIWNNPDLEKRKAQVTVVKEAMADNLCLVAALGVEQAVSTIEKASARDAIVITGIAIDKMRLLGGESTANVALEGYINLCNATPV